MFGKWMRLAPAATMVINFVVIVAAISLMMIITSAKFITFVGRLKI